MEQNWFILGGTKYSIGRYCLIYNMGQNWLIHDGTGSLWCGTGWYLVILGRYNLVLLGIVKLLG